MTLVRAEDWHSLPHADDLKDGDLVWGVAYRIDPVYVPEVRAYLDHREKDGYSCQTVDVMNVHDGVERVVVKAVSCLLFVRVAEADLHENQANVYVGLRENPSFIGPEPLDALVKLIYRSIGRELASLKNITHS